MAEIPDDVMKAANECVSEFRWNNDNRWHLFVARAILAERERCAKVAKDAQAEFANDSILWWKDGMTNASNDSAQMAKACAIISGLINNS